MNRRAMLRSSITALAALWLPQAGFALLQPLGVSRRLRFTISLTNPKNHELLNQTLWFYIPIPKAPAQSLQAISISMPYRQLTDPLGHGIVELTFPRFSAASTKMVSVSVELEMRKTPEPEALKNPGIWLTAERFIETVQPQIQELAASLKRNSALETGKAIFEWVRSHLRYAGYVQDDRGALDALTSGMGDCTEYAYLAVALARANDIPARMVGGFAVDKDSAPRAEAYHNWAELYIEGTWQLLDAQKANWLTPADQYVAFRYYQEQILNPIGSAHRFRVDGELNIRI